MNNENFEIVFSILNTANKEERIVEKTQLKYLDENKQEINHKLLTNKSKKEVHYIIEIPLQKNNEYILIKEEHKAIFEHYSIIVGDQTKLIKATSKTTNKTYFFDKEIYEEIKNTLQLEEIQKITPQYLQGKKYTWPYKTIEKIDEIREYSREKLNTELMEIHLVHHNKLEFFLPTLNQKHNSIAHDIKIPVVSVRSDQYFEGTTIHRDDEVTHRNELKPITITEEIKNKKIFQEKIIEKELITQLYLKIEKDEILKNFSKLKEHNLDEEKILELSKKKELLFGTKNGTICLPLFKGETYKTYSSIKEFENAATVHYKNNKTFLQEIYIQKNARTPYRFKNYFLNSKLNEICNNKAKEKHFECISHTQAIIVLQYFPKCEQITITQKISQNKIKELLKHITSLSKHIIIKSLEENHIPKEKRATSAIENYLLSKYSYLEKKFQEYKKDNNKKELLSQSLKTINQILKLKKTITMQKEELYFLYQCNLTFIKIASEFDSEKTHKISMLLTDYFGEVKLRPMISKINEKNEKIIEDIILLKRISKKYSCLIEIKSDIYNKYLANSISQLPKHNREDKIFYRANTHKIKQIAPYRYKEICKQINGNKQPNKITIGKREISLKEKEHYFITRFHNNYKEIISNEIFSLFVKH